MKCSIASGSISSQKPAFFSLTAVKVHDSQAYRNMEMTRERISFTFDPRDMLLSLQMGFSFVRAAVACAILERTSGLEPSSETTAPRYFEGCYSAQLLSFYSSIQMKCQGGNKYVLSITVKFDQSTRRFGRISFARLFKFTKHIALLFYLLSPYLLSCMRGSRNARTDMHIIKNNNEILRALEHRLRYGEF